MWMWTSRMLHIMDIIYAWWRIPTAVGIELMMQRYLIQASLSKNFWPRFSRNVLMLSIFYCSCISSEGCTLFCNYILLWSVLVGAGNRGWYLCSDFSASLHASLQEVRITHILSVYWHFWVFKSCDFSSTMALLETWMVLWAGKAIVILWSW